MDSSKIAIRRALIEDVPALLDIYNDEVLHGTSTFDIQPKTLDEWVAWFRVHNRENHPLLVAEREGDVVGYATLSSFREKKAYQGTVELSVYVSADARREGVATALMGEILRMAREDERTHAVVSVITAGNEASVALHERFGFKHCGTLHEVGRKFDGFLNVEFYELNVSIEPGEYEAETG